MVVAMACPECLVVRSCSRISEFFAAATAAGLALVLMSSTEVRAQQSAVAAPRFVMTSWTEQNGLPSNQVEALAQTPDGYLWVGTQGGLMRFDGVRFVRVDASDGPRLPTLGVSALHVGHNGNLWVGFGGSGGISRIDGDRIVNYEAASGSTRGRVLAIADSTDGTVWAGGVDGLFRLRQNRWERVHAQDGFSGHTVVSLYEDRHGNLWLGADAGLFLRRAGSQRFELYSAQLARANGISEAPSGLLLVSTPAGVYTTSGVDAGFRLTWPEGGENYFRLRHDGHGNLWVATLGGGLLRVSPRAVGRAAAATRFTIQTGLIGDLVWSVLDDREGNIWVGTQNGLTRLTPSRVLSMISPGPSRIVRAVEATRDGAIWAATPAGLIRYLRDDEEWHEERVSPKVLDVTALHTDRHGTLWVATVNGLYRYQQDRLTAVPVLGGMQPRWPVAITTDHQGGLWILARNGRLLLWRAGELSPVDRQGVHERSALGLYTDSRGNVWVGFAGAIVVFRDGNVDRPVEMATANGAQVDTFLEGQTGVMWLGSAESLSRFDDGRLTTLALERAGFSGSHLTGILDDGDGNLWLGVRAGIVRLTLDEFDRGVAGGPDTVRYQLLDTSDGLNGSPGSIGRPSAVRAADGTLAFITGHSVSMVSPHLVDGRQPPPAVRIERVVADERSFSLAGDLHLPPRTNRIQIDYTALTLVASERVRFRYWLEGFDNAWIDAGHSRQAVYTNLPPGSYRFHVAARNKEGLWSESSATSRGFMVQPAFYQTPWFIGGWLVMTGVGLWGAWLLRVRHLRNGFALVLAERARVAREIHDTLLQTLVGLTLKVDAVEGQIDSETEVTTMKHQLATVRRQLQRSIRETRESIRDLRCPELERRTLADALREAGEVICGGRLAFELTADGQPVRYPKTVEEQILRIAQECLTNVVRHADARLVSVTLRYASSGITLRVADDGRGFNVGEPAGAPDHWGVLTMGERTAQFGGQLDIRSRPGEGTVIEVSVPAPLARRTHASSADGYA